MAAPVQAGEVIKSVPRATPTTRPREVTVKLAGRLCAVTKITCNHQRYFIEVARHLARLNRCLPHTHCPTHACLQFHTARPPAGRPGWFLGVGDRGLRVVVPDRDDLEYAVKVGCPTRKLVHIIGCQACVTVCLTSSSCCSCCCCCCSRHEIDLLHMANDAVSHSLSHRPRPMLRSVRPSVCLSVCPMRPQARNRCISGLWQNSNPFIHSFIHLYQAAGLIE